MFNAKPTGDENGDFVVGNDFRQVSSIEERTEYDSSGLFTGETGFGLKKLVLTSVNDAFVDDLIIEGGTSGAKAYIDDVDSNGVFIHQSEYTGFKSFQASETISINEGGGSTTATLVVFPIQSLMLSQENSYILITRL